MTEVSFISHCVKKKAHNISEAKSNLSSGGRGKTDPGIETSSTRVESPLSLFTLNMEECAASKMLDLFDPEMADSVQNFSHD